MPELSLVVPCRNEEARLPGTLEALTRHLAAGDPSWEILLVVEPSRDATPHLAAAAARRDPRIRALLNPEARGKGWAVRTGMLAALGDCVFFMDADLSVPPRFIGPFLEAITSGADVAIGSRRHPRSVIPTPQPPARVLAGRLFNLALRAAGATRFLDTQCGFKAFRREAARAVFSRVEAPGFGFDVEALAWAQALGLRVIEIPVNYRGRLGESKITGSFRKAVAVGLNMIALTLGYRVRS
ncbi:MAG: glycosyltransferase, partial [Terrimicrobiaceae bacterium]|nr:glycosyltransferase [Terrimicrobiaceae bacterium]